MKFNILFIKKNNGINCFFRYVHYEVDNHLPLDSSSGSGNGVNDHTVHTTNPTLSEIVTPKSVSTNNCPVNAELTLYPPQWIQCDLRYLDMTVLGKFAVIMADPPWDIHMELPYGTMSDDEMRQLGIPALQGFLHF